MLRFDKPAIYFLYFTQCKGKSLKPLKVMIIETKFSGFDVECDSNLCLASGGRVLESLLATLLQEVGLYTEAVSALLNLIVAGRPDFEH